MRWGLRRDFWLAVRPDLVSLEGPIARADREFADSPGEVQAMMINTLTELYRQDPPPAAFRAIVSPLVAWIWIGGAIALLGALWRRGPRPRRACAACAQLSKARLGRELTRA